jgi:iron complex transport system substrate-binding protein
MVPMAFASPIPLTPLAACCGATALLLSGCGADPETDTEASGAVLDNCGIEIDAEEPPERVFASYQPAIEMAHALGLSDRLVGTAFLDAVVMDAYAEAQQDQVYFERNPSREELLGLEPDFVLAGYNGVFTDEEFGTRASLEELGVRTWIFSPLCPSDDGLTDETIDPADVTLDNVYADLRDLGALFDVEDTAEAVIEDMQARIDEVAEAVAEADETPEVIIGRPDDEGFRVSGGPDFGTEIIELAGGVNAAEDLDEARNVDLSTEALIERDPDFILVDVCCDAEMTAADAADDVAAIMDDPALANVTAVEEEQVVEFTFADRAASVRSAESVALVAELIHPGLLD